MGSEHISHHLRRSPNIPQVPKTAEAHPPGEEPGKRGARPGAVPPATRGLAPSLDSCLLPWAAVFPHGICPPYALPVTASSAGPQAACRWGQGALELERTPTATPSKLLRAALRTTRTPMRGAAQDPLSQTTKRRLREAGHRAQGHTAARADQSCHAEPPGVHLKTLGARGWWSMPAELFDDWKLCVLKAHARPATRIPSISSGLVTVSGPPGDLHLPALPLFPQPQHLEPEA